MSGVFSFPVTVYYENTDAQGIVYYAEYLKFMERARTEFLKAAGITQHVLRVEEDVIFVVRHVDLTYHAPAILDDCLDVTLDVDTEPEEAPIKLKFCQKVKRGEQVMVSGSVIILCLKGGKVIQTPQKIWDKMRFMLNHEG